MNKNKIKLSSYLIYVLGFLTLLISFYFNIDGTGTPLSGDFIDTWPYVLKLKNSFFFDPSQWTLHFPLHYYFLSKLNIIFTDARDVRLIFCLISFITPYFFYLCLKNKYKEKKHDTLFILSAIILFTPSYIYSAIWANDNNTSYIFILTGSYFFFKYVNLNDNINKNHIYLYSSFLLFALACYSRQYYSVFYAFFLVYFFKKIRIKNYILLLIISGLLSLPGLFFLYSFPALYKNLVFSGNIFNTILSNVVSISFYTFPILGFNIYYSGLKIINLKKVFLYAIISLITFILIMLNYNLDSMSQNGGIFFIGSKLIFGNYFLFYIIFLINFILILIIFENKQDLFLLFSILFVISGIIVLQKYFEPLFFIFFFLFSNSNFKEIFINNKKASIMLVLYHFIYYLTSVSDIMYKIKFI